MRFPTWPNLIRTLYTISNYTTRSQTSYKTLQPLTRSYLKSMPSIPFLGSLFSSSSSSKMSYPLQKSDDEWQAVLSKGMYPVYLASADRGIKLTYIQNNFAF